MSVASFAIAGWQSMNFSVPFKDGQAGDPGGRLRVFFFVSVCVWTCGSRLNGTNVQDAEAIVPQVGMNLAWGSGIDGQPGWDHLGD